MVFSLCACGKSETSGASSSSASSSASSTESEVAKSDAPDGYAYKSSYKVLFEGASEYMSALYYADDGFYATYNEVVGEREHEGEEQTYSGQFNIYAPVIVYIDYATGTVKKLDKYVPLEAPSEGEEDQFDYSSSIYINGLTETDDGNVCVLEILGEYWMSREDISFDDPEYWDCYNYTQKYCLRKLSKDGELLSELNLDVSEDEYLTGALLFDEDGNFVVASDECIRGIDAEGNEKYNIDLHGYCENINKLTDGSICLSVYHDNGTSKIYELDIDSKSLVDIGNTPESAYILLSGGGDYPLYYNSGVTFYGFDINSGESHKLFNWIDIDVNGDTIASAKVLSDGKIVTSASTYDLDDGTFTVELYTVEKVPAEEIPVKESITLATQSLSYYTKAEIVDFNRKSDKYHIDVIDYSEYNTDDDYSAGLTKMTTEIMAGNVPDIIDLTGLSMSQLAAKGILEDLYPYIDRDFNRSDYFENVFEACEINGKLYTTIPGFTVITLVGASRVVGDEPGWTYDEFYEALDSMPDGCTPLEKYITRESMLNSCLSLDLSDFVNWETGEVDFNNDEFISLLKFVNSFPESFDWDNYDYSDEKSTSEAIAAGEQMLERISLYSVDDVMYNNADFGGTETTYIGYPTLNGTGNMIYVDSGLAITSTSANKEAAWSFLKTFFTEDYQKNQYGSFPTIRALFEKKLKKAMTPDYITDAAGNILLDEDGNERMVAKYTSLGPDGESINYYCLSEKQGQALRDVVETTTKLYTTDESIASIVKEEAEAYFSGQKSAEEVARLIQSKVNIYVNEQR